ncbi:MAG: hypothetical protein BGO21_29085 [Dyadobacter sp. 50-39]|uniref:DUF6934 family protein n=1 Tax=Dyadobacter sp. 50-39 TaxID=1895756 RepID=UPI00095BEDFD|nr:hypothetical protein [Dyadobacter sp. 50-39]OJV16903.1 MAG: hypothetical protein BGO21_29085 [Dyadobacter sp. 50-39]
MKQYQAYLTESNEENTRFQFQSIGKRGVFEKVIFFTPLTSDTYNLSLVDYNTKTNSYDDLSVTDNGDMPEVLVTVISTIHRFLGSNPGKKIYFEGSTPARTRLYQIAIGKIYDPQKSDLLIKGLQDNQWFPFEPNINFQGFLAEEKP